MEPSISLFDSTAAEFAAKVDRQIVSGHYRRGELFLAAAKAYVPMGGSILDYGCGPGRISRLLAGNGFRVLGVDFSQGMIAAAREQPLETLQAEFETVEEWTNDVKNRRFDAVVCSSVIEYVPDPAQLLERFAAVLSPTGLLIISFANSESIFRILFQHRNCQLGAQMHTWSWQRFQSLLERADFQRISGPKYFEGPVSQVRRLNFLTASQFVGGLGLVVAKKKAKP